MSPECVCEVLAQNTQQIIFYSMFKGSLHPFALRGPLLENQSFYWMVVQHSLIFPWDERNPLFTFFTSSYNDAKIVILRHCRRKCKRGGFLLRLQTLVPHLSQGAGTAHARPITDQWVGLYSLKLKAISSILCEAKLTGAVETDVKLWQ